MKFFCSIFAIAVVFLLATFTFVQAQQKITIVAAANLKVALDSLVSVFKADNSGAEILTIYGASGKLFEQISNSAPFDIFLSADMEFPNKLKSQNMAISDVKMYAIGQLVIWSKKIDPNISQINSLLNAKVQKIAIGNPATAPYGEKAVESMKYFQIYDKIKGKLVLGENISQAAQFVTSGAADIGILALSLALTPNLQKEGGKYFVIPQSSHKPLEQGCVILKHAQGNSLATKFFEFISSPKAVNILSKFGYSQKAK